MEKRFNKWLVISFMLGVCVFCFAYLTKSTIGANAVTPTTAEAEKPKVPATEAEKPLPMPIIYNTLPKPAIVRDNRTVQNVGGAEDDVLKSVHTVSGKTYLFFDSASNGYDVKSDSACVAVAVLDDDLTLNKVCALSGTSAESFSDVKLTAEGFILVTAAANYNSVYKLNFDLVVTSKLNIETSDSARLYSYNNRFYLMLQKPDKLQIKVLSQSLEVLQTCSTSLENARITEIFPDDNCLNIFVNGTDYYGLLRYTDSGFISVNTVNGSTLTSVLPYDADGEQGFVGLKKSESFKLFTTDKLFNQTAEIDLGTADYAALFAINDNFSVYLKYSDNTAKSSVYCKHLDLILENSSAVIFNSIGYCGYASQELTLIANCGNKLYLIAFDGVNYSVTAEYLATGGYSYITHDNTLCFSSPLANSYAKNYGGKDVYLIKSA